MRIEPCPSCGRAPIIKECLPDPKGTRRRICRCPNSCLVVPSRHYPGHYQYSFLYIGDGDDNAILRNWNSGVRYSKKYGWVPHGAPVWICDEHVQQN